MNIREGIDEMALFKINLTVTYHQAHQHCNSILKDEKKRIRVDGEKLIKYHSLYGLESHTTRMHITPVHILSSHGQQIQPVQVTIVISEGKFVFPLLI